MEKKKTIVLCLMTLLIFCLICIKLKNNPIDSDIALYNIEALALNEGGGNFFCMGTGSLDCPSTHIKVAFIKRF